MIALARKCAAKYWQTGNKMDDLNARRILSGEWDDLAYVQAALAMALEITERAAKMAETVPVTVPLAPGMAEGVSIAGRAIATALRRFEHVGREG